jgi:hypothetical protein
VTPDDVRGLALALPEVTEADHHGRPSFRLGGSVLATLWDDGALHVLVGESEARAAEGGACSLLWWGRRLSGVRVDLAAADEDLVADLLQEAWTRRAPARLRRAGPPSA